MEEKLRTIALNLGKRGEVREYDSSEGGREEKLMG